MEFNANEINAEIIAQLEAANDEIIKVIKQGQEEYGKFNKDALLEKLYNFKMTDNDILRTQMKQNINNLVDIAMSKPTHIRISKQLLKILDEHKEPNDYVLELNKALKEDHKGLVQSNDNFSKMAAFLKRDIQEQFLDDTNKISENGMIE